jgi:hypothetical protein
LTRAVSGQGSTGTTYRESASDRELRANVDQGLIVAPDKWRAHLLHIANAYEKAYNNHSTVLHGIEQQQRAEAELATFMASLILPSLLGGFVGGLISGKAKPALDAITDQASKFRWSVAVDVAKTVASDMAKAEVRIVYQKLIETSGWRPTSISPLAFLIKEESSVAEFMTAIGDAMNNSRMGRGAVSYRDVLTGIYWSPFIRQAPETEDLLDVDLLARALEVFLWVDWAKHRDVDYWRTRISTVLGPRDSSLAGGTLYDVYAHELKQLNPILERMDSCGVRREYITQGMSVDGYRFLDLIMLGKLGPQYQGKLLGDLIEGLNGGDPQFSMSRRPKESEIM